MLLKGIKILDLSNLLPGPMCSLFLADLGADVIKIESPKGDLMRRFESNNHNSPYFSALNRNKKSIVLNLKTKEGKKIFMQLARNADVIIEGFRPGKVHSLGISYNRIKKINPKIVYCSISGYGQKSLYRNKAGHDLNYSSLSGLLDLMSTKPLVPGVQVADIGCSFVAAVSILASLFYRERHEKGNYIDVSVFDASLSLINIHIAQRSVSKESKTILSGSKPCYNVYETKDKKLVSLGAIETKFWKSFCNAVNRKDLIKKQFDESKLEEMQKLFKSKTQKEWLKLSEKFDFCCEPVKNIEEIIHDRNLKGRIITLDGIKQVSLPVIFSSFTKINYSKAPKLSEHTEKILLGIGYNKRAINELRKKEVIL